MKSFSFSTICALLLTKTSLTLAQDSHPCIKYPVKVSKLRQCATASAFCSGFIGTATFTRTSTVTEASYSTTTAVAGSTLTTDTTSVSTVTSSVCPLTITVRDERRVVATPLAAAPAAPSCGIARNADLSRVSGACQCILASSTKTTTTIATTGASTTTDAASTATSFSTTSTVTSCVTPTGTSFMLQAVGGIYDGNYAVLNMGGQGNNKRFLDKRIAVGPGVDMTGTINFQPASAGNTGTIFHLSTDGVWTSASGLPAYLDNTCGAAPVYQIRLMATDRYNLGALTCSVADNMFTCTNGNGSEFFSPCRGADIDLHFAGPQGGSDNGCSDIALRFIPL